MLNPKHSQFMELQTFKCSNINKEMSFKIFITENNQGKV